jgi:hypothetical protein
MELPPCLQQRNAVELNQPLDLAELPSTEAQIAAHGHRREPDLAALLITVHMNVGRFIGLMAIEIQAIGPAA